MAFVTTTVMGFKPIFSDHRLATETLRQLGETAGIFEAALVGYVLMPSHLHILVGLKDYNDVSTLMQSFKSLSARRIKQHLEGLEKSLNDGFRLWRPRFDELIITSKEQFDIKLNYIHLNPVKAGLVSLAEDYPFSSASDWILDKPGLIVVDKNFAWLGAPTGRP